MFSIRWFIIGVFAGFIVVNSCSCGEDETIELSRPDVGCVFTSTGSIGRFDVPCSFGGER